jgi:uridine kinase
MSKMLLFFCFFSMSLFAVQPIFIAIAGGTGSGKSTLAGKLHEAFPESTLISQDSYYRDLPHLSFEERAKTNFDHPDSLEFSLLKTHLIDLKNGRAIECPTYSFHIHAREKETTLIQPTQIVIVEGILLLASTEVRDLFDIKIFVDTDDDVRVLRRAERDMRERSRDFNSIKEQYQATVKPMHDAYVAPSKKYADIIIPGEGDSKVAINLLLSLLAQEI